MESVRELFLMAWHQAWALVQQSPLDPLSLLAHYQESHRRYHNLQHIVECLSRFDEYALNARETLAPSISFALIYHDVIYDPRSNENEIRSASFARAQLAPILPPALLSDIERLICITNHRTPPAHPDEQLIVDIDLSILGQSSEIFDAYEQAIRLEYAHVPDDAFRAGRARILQAFLDRLRLYHTPYFSRQYEATARVNLNRSLSRLRTP